MVLPDQPVTLTVEQIRELNQKLSTLRHDVNNNLALVIAAAEIIRRPAVTTLGLGVSKPGVIDYREQRGVLSPNVPITDGRSPRLDLQALLSIPCVLVQESHCLCLHINDIRISL